MSDIETWFSVMKENNFMEIDFQLWWGDRHYIKTEPSAVTMGTKRDKHSEDFRLKITKLLNEYGEGHKQNTTNVNSLHL